jgi:hypothetical protein
MCNVDWHAVLKKAKSYDTAEEDDCKIARALKALYPEEVESCKALPGYTPEKLLSFVMDEIRDWSRLNSPDLFRAVMAERYRAGGLGGKEAAGFIEGELDAARRNTFYYGIGG